MFSINQAPFSKGWELLAPTHIQDDGPQMLLGKRIGHFLSGIQREKECEQNTKPKPASCGKAEKAERHGSAMWTAALEAASAAWLTPSLGGHAPGGLGRELRLAASCLCRSFGCGEHTVGDKQDRATGLSAGETSSNSRRVALGYRSPRKRTAHLHWVCAPGSTSTTPAPPTRRQLLVALIALPLGLCVPCLSPKGNSLGQHLSIAH